MKLLEKGRLILDQCGWTGMSMKISRKREKSVIRGEINQLRFRENSWREGMRMMVSFALLHIVL